MPENAKRGPPKRYTERFHLRIDADTLAKLDKLRGQVSRSEYIRRLIRYASTSAREKLERLCNALADDIDALSDEELLAELKEAGEDINVTATHIRELIRNAGQRRDKQAGRGRAG